ncbi:MAG TPA: enolase C-terminal domain-like protein, partial [Xanthomonadales bacterium]|nr:enolase C-terminal domain-like protein [Xanthomonadales bacterium]
WLEEPLIPDDYAGYAELKRRLPNTTIATGEHEYTRYGFSQLIDCGVDVLQPDMMWCGGLTEAVRITELAAAANRLVIPHGSGPYAYHHQVCFANTPYAEFLMLSPEGDVAVPQFGGLFRGEPLPVNGVISLGTEPGFGINLDRNAASLVRPFPV